MNLRARDPDIKTTSFMDSKPGSQQNAHLETSEREEDLLQKSQVNSTPIACPPQTSFPMSILYSRILPGRGTFLASDNSPSHSLVTDILSYAHPLYCLRK